MKIRPVPAKFIRSDGQTKVEKLKVAFWKFCESA